MFFATVAFSELAVPQGAIVLVPVVQTVVQPRAITKIEASEIRWQLPAGTNGLTIPRCIVSKIYTYEDGTMKTVVTNVPLQKVAAYLQASGSSLSNVVSVLTGAVQMQVNEEFGQ